MSLTYGPLLTFDVSNPVIVLIYVIKTVSQTLGDIIFNPHTSPTILFREVIVHIYVDFIVWTATL
jgi:hypothetical protein